MSKKKKKQELYEYQYTTPNKKEVKEIYTELLRRGAMECKSAVSQNWPTALLLFMV